MTKERINARVPKYLLEWLKDYKKRLKIETTTEVIIYALDTLRNIDMDVQKGDYERLEFVPNKMGITNESPKEKLLKKIANDRDFKQAEYDIVQNKKLTDEQLKDYTENYQDLGMSLQDYYKAFGKK